MMIARLMATTAVVLMLAGGAYADNNTTTTPAATPAASNSTLITTGFTVTADDAIASKVIGTDVYDSIGQNAQQIGTIKDLVLDKSGKVAAAIIGVGGFLGAGQKDVAVDYGQIKWNHDANGALIAVMNTTKQALTNAPAFQYPKNTSAQAMNNAPAPGVMAPAPAPGTVATVPAAGAVTTTTPAPGTTSMTSNSGNMAANANAPTPEVDVSKLKPVAATTLQADDLKGIDVINPQGDKLGSINDFVLDKNGKGIDAVIIDFGGFLGIGTKQVALAYDNLKFVTDGNNNRYLEVNVTKAQLKAQQAYNKDTYVKDRAQQRMDVSSL